MLQGKYEKVIFLKLDMPTFV